MEKSLKTIKEYWQLIMFLGMLVILMANILYRLNSVEAAQKEDETTLIQLMSVKTDVAIIKNDVMWIRGQLDKQ